MKSMFITLVIVIALLICVGEVNAIEEATRDSVSGPVSGTWNLAGSPYYVIGNANVPTNSTLIINPGVEVIFNGPFQLSVGTNATLQAMGAEGDSVIFTSAVPGVIFWNGIRFLNASSACSLTYCVIEYGDASGSGANIHGGGIYCLGTDLLLSHSTIRFCSATGNGGGMYCATCSPTLEYSSFIENSADNGGGLHLESAYPVIYECHFNDNSALGNGGGICSLVLTDLQINLTTFFENSASSGGGIYISETTDSYIWECQISYCVASDCGGGIYIHEWSWPQIFENKIVDGNMAREGGGIYILNSNPIINNNIISNNSAEDGGGIYITGYTPNIGPDITSNTISKNSARYGGGIYCTGWDPLITYNSISENYALIDGGGSYFTQHAPADSLEKNTYYGNVAGGLGGGIYLPSFPITISNSIFWKNIDSSGIDSLMQIHPSSFITAPTVKYSDVQGGWPGTANINQYPAFVDTAWDDFRLHWISPCIDAGDPSPSCNDPDGTRADMGCYFFDQSDPVRVLLTPHTTSHSIIIPSGGSSFDYTIWATNITAVPQLPTVRIDVTLPNGSTFGPVLGGWTINIAGDSTLSYVGTQNVPTIAPEGGYRYNAWAVVGGSSSTDYFYFEKTATHVDEIVPGGWINTGELPEEVVLSEKSRPITCSLEQVYPNPFNPSTTISFQLSAFSHVSLRVYDVSGRQVAELVNDCRNAGNHEVMFDASGLPSGVYFAQLNTGTTQYTQKLLLVK